MVDKQPDFLIPSVMINGPVFLSEPDPEWPKWYLRQECRIRDALGDRVIQIEHVGSTSVPGLAAKPVIDIVLVVADSSDETAYVPQLELAGYRLKFREPEWFEHRFLAGEPSVQIHVFSVGAPEIDKMLTFRDRLRACPDERELYESTKRRLAAARWTYVQDYAEAKSEVVEAIVGRARSSRLGTPSSSAVRRTQLGAGDP